MARLYRINQIGSILIITIPQTNAVSIAESHADAIYCVPTFGMHYFIASTAALIRRQASFKLASEVA